MVHFLAHRARAWGTWAVCALSLTGPPACSQPQEQEQPAVSAPAPTTTSTEAQTPPMPTPAALGSTAPKPPPKMRWVPSSPATIAAGKATFGACMGCHGEDASGRIGIGPRVASDSYLAAASDDFLVSTIKNGRTGTTMIPWGTAFKEPQINGLVAYLRSLHPTEPAQLDERGLDGDAQGGSQVFRDICSGCHGRNGAGYQETANGTGIGRKAFLDTATNGFLRYIVKEGKTLTKMRGFSEKNRTAVANLTDAQIDDTIAYLRKNAW